MLQNPCKTFGFKKNMVYKISPGGGVNISSQWPIKECSEQVYWLPSLLISFFMVMSCVIISTFLSWGNS